METTVNQRILIQILFWCFLMLGMPYLLGGDEFLSKHVTRASSILSGVVIMLIANLKFLFPRFYIKKSLSFYLIIIIITIITLRLIYSFFIEIGGLNIIADLEKRFISMSANPIPKGKRYIINALGGAVPLFIATIASSLYEITIVANKSIKEAAQLKAEKLEAELKFLKSQINPHFLFNSLNNIYTLTVLDPSQAGQSLLKLSEMLRYLLYECDADKVPIGRELAYLKNYVDLFSLKDEENLNITFDINDVNEEVMIAPLLLIPFVENAFKHSHIEDLENGWIKISMLGDEKQVYFEVKNSIPDMEFAKDEVGGIGLQNVKRQLELLYPNNHQLKIERENGHFGVYLTVYL